MKAQRVTIPYLPRSQQLEVHELMRRHRYGVLVCHRRFGKTVLAVNELLKGACECTRERPRFGYIAPTYQQGKAIAWDYFKHYAHGIPGVKINQSELRVDLPNGGQVRIYGSDNPDSLRGLYFDGVVLDEFGLMAPNAFSEVIRPTLADRAGWALFIGTPNGKNQFYDLAQKARLEQDGNSKLWFFRSFPVSSTKLLPADELAQARQMMSADEYEQEFECSFEAAVKGAIYRDELEDARRDGRITKVPYDPSMLVQTTWDLGVGDATAIWFSQHSPGGEVRLIDYYEASGEGLPHYAAVLEERRYQYGKHWAPHDIQVRELGSGLSRLEIAKNLGIRFEVVPRVAGKVGTEVEEGIHAARMLFPRCWFDERKCKAGLEALMHYRRDYNQRLKEFKRSPLHDWSSHAADAFRYLAIRSRVAGAGMSKPMAVQFPEEYAWS